MSELLTYNEAKFLVEKNILNENCGVIIKNLSYNCNDEYGIKKITLTPENVIITILDDNGMYRHYKEKSILKIDGMNPKKLFKAYNESDNQRGRPKKSL